MRTIWVNLNTSQRLAIAIEIRGFRKAHRDTGIRANIGTVRSNSHSVRLAMRKIFRHDGCKVYDWNGR